MPNYLKDSLMKYAEGDDGNPFAGLLAAAAPLLGSGSIPQGDAASQIDYARAQAEMAPYQRQMQAAVDAEAGRTVGKLFGNDKSGLSEGAKWLYSWLLNSKYTPAYSAQLQGLANSYRSAREFEADKAGLEDDFIANAMTSSDPAVRRWGYLNKALNTTKDPNKQWDYKQRLSNIESSSHPGLVSFKRSVDAARYKMQRYQDRLNQNLNTVRSTIPQVLKHRGFLLSPVSGQVHGYANDPTAKAAAGIEKAQRAPNFTITDFSQPLPQSQPVQK